MTVLDLSRVLAGPWATQLLADYGAEVIKVERPGAGDDTRGWGPPFQDNGVSAYFQAANRNKKSIEVNLASAEGQRLIRELATKADVVVENFKTGALAKYGLDAESLQKVNPALVYCSITGFGQTGPLADRPGYDFLLQAMGGLMSVTGQPDGQPGAEPMKVGVAVVDLFTGRYAVSGLLAAVHEARSTGRGRVIDLSLFDCQLAMLANQATNYLVSGTSPGRLGNAHPNIVPYQVFETADGHVVIAVGNDRQYVSCCKALELPAAAGEEKFATNASRVAHREELIALMAPVVRQLTSEQVIAGLEKAGVPCAMINDVEAALSCEQALSRQMVLDHGEGGKTVAPPVKFGGTDEATPPPLLGAHTAEVLKTSLGLTEEEISTLRAAGAIGPAAEEA